MKGDERECRKCEFWEEVESTPYSVGFCHRHAPSPVAARIANKVLYPDIADNVLNLSMEDIVTEWPSTYQDDWCGEFKPRDA